MRARNWAALIALAAVGCDARASEEYRGEPLFSVTGTLRVDSALDWSNLAPVVLFYDSDWTKPQVVLDVDTRGEFPAKFTVDVMQPPPAAAMQKVSGMPSFAVGTLTALPRDHGPTFLSPKEEGEFSYPTNEERRWAQSGVFYRHLTICFSETECYEETAQCEDRYEGECNTIVEQMGDPKLKERLAEFADRVDPLRSRKAYMLVYIANDGPLDMTRGYLPNSLTPYISDLFGKGPMTPGYHLAVWTSPIVPEDQQPALQLCLDEASNAAAVRLAALHGKDFKNYLDFFVFTLMDTHGAPYNHPYYQDYGRLVLEEEFDRSCMASGLHPLDASSDPLEITLDHGNLPIPISL